MRLVLGGSVFGGDAISVGCDWSGVMRSSVDRSWWIGLRWLYDLGGGARYMAAPVLGCDRFWVNR